MPPGSPVADCSSRAIAAPIRPSGSEVRPASASAPTSLAIAACLSPSTSVSSSTRSRVMIGGEVVELVMGTTLVSRGQRVAGIGEIGAT